MTNIIGYYIDHIRSYPALIQLTVCRLILLAIKRYYYLYVGLNVSAMCWFISEFMTSGNMKGQDV